MEVIHESKIPFALISAYFPEGYPLFRFPGRLLGWRLNRFDKIFVQNVESQERLERLLKINIAEVSGDTRVDRVVQNRSSASDLSLIKEFIGTSQVLVIGSNWPSDDELLMPVVEKLEDLKVIVAPHEMGDKQLLSWKERFGQKIIDYDELENGHRNAQLLYVNRIGLLMSLYQVATVAYVGGGFGVSVHNTLEAAVWSIPVICGPKNGRFLEIQQLKARRVIFEINDSTELYSTLNNLLNSSEARDAVRSQAESYFQKNSGATALILDWIRKVT